jgi:Spy/CpxP family protein refolding chaperone
MTSRLDLSADQATQIRASFKERRDNPDLTRTEGRDRILAVLTDEQRKKFEDTAGRRGGRRGGPDCNRGPGPDAGKGPGPGL